MSSPYCQRLQAALDVAFATMAHPVWVQVDNLGRVWTVGRTDNWRVVRSKLGTSPATVEAAETLADYGVGQYRYEPDGIGTLVAEVWEEVRAGKHDTSQGLRPTDVFVNRDGDIAVWYPADPAGKWIAWSTVVR